MGRHGFREKIKKIKIEGDNVESLRGKVVSEVEWETAPLLYYKGA